MSNILEALDISKIILSGIIQGTIIFFESIFNAGYPTNILILILLFGSPIIKLLRSR